MKNYPVPRTAEFEARQLCLSFGRAARDFLSTLTRCVKGLKKSYALTYPTPKPAMKLFRQFIFLLDDLAQISFRWEIPSFADTLRPNTP